MLMSSASMAVAAETTSAVDGLIAPLATGRFLLRG